MNNTAQQTYDAYKDSGIDWVGEIPETWNQIANKHLFRLRKTQVGKRASEYDLLSLTLRGIIKRDMENPEGKFPAEFDTYQEVRPGDFVFCHFDVEETPRTVGLSTHFGMITGAYTVYEPTGEADSGFLYYFYLHADTDKNLRSLYKGLRNTIPKDTFATFKTPLPPLPEQRAIAAFLDTKCGKIDEAVRIKEEQITLLKERRQILIQQAVTRGLNPDAPMKDSGIDWIGKIPAHWEVRRAKHLFREVNERSEGGAEELLSVSHTTGVTARSEKNVNMFLAEDYTGSKLCRPGDVVINTMWAWMGAMGVSDLTGIISPSYGVYRSLQEGAFNRRFLEWLLRTTPFIEQYNKISTGLHSSRLRLYPHMFLGLPMAYPSREEQDAIITEVEREAGKIDTAISLKESQIAALKEYKTSLINAAVTGKIKVS